MTGKLKTLGLQYHKQTPDSSNWQLQLLDPDIEHKAQLNVEFRKKESDIHHCLEVELRCGFQFLFITHISPDREKQKQLYFLMSFKKAR